MRSVTCIMLFLCLFLSCQEQEQTKEVDKKSKEVEARAIVLQPFTGFSAKLADSLLIEIRKVNPKTTMNKPIPLPDMAYNKERSRYRADSLIDFLWTKSTNKNVIIGLTDKDISTTKGEYKDWGVMGLGYKPGHSCVVSTFRLSKKNIHSQLYKLALHELGHTEGLPHCIMDSTCYMSDAKGTNPWQRATDFCYDCKSFLLNKGWKVN